MFAGSPVQAAIAVAIAIPFVLVLLGVALLSIHRIGPNEVGLVIRRWGPRRTEGGPIAFIKSVMSDETLIEDWTLDGKWSGSGILTGDEQPDTNDMKPGHILYIRSWSGARDRMIRG